jgi:hypothetical protein
MGWNPFKKIKKAIKKVASGIKKVVKKTVKGIKKVVKKISSSKILKALAIAAAVVVTGGAAVAAFTGGAGVAAGTAGSTFANWMMTTSQAVTGGALFGTGATGVTGALQTAGNVAAQTIASPFKAVGTALGSAAATVTDFTGLTTEAGRTGFVPSGLTDAEISQVLTETPASIASSTTSGTLNLPTTLPAAGPVPTQLSTGTLTMPTTLPAGTSIGTSSGVQNFSYVGTAGSPEAQQLAQTVPSALGIDPSVATQATQATQSWAARNPRTAEFLTNVGTGVATSVATGYAMQQLAGDPEETGSMAGLRTEGASSFDPLRVYAAERGIADADISKYFTFGNTPEAGNMPLFQQQTIGVA